MIEYDEQCQVFEWSKYEANKHPCLKFMYSTLNGVRLTIGQAMKARRSGNKRGVPDIVLPFNNGNYSGLYIELKTIKGYASKEQKEYIKFLSENNYKAIICRGANEAIDAISEYLK